MVTLKYLRQDENYGSFCLRFSDLWRQTMRKSLGQFWMWLVCYVNVIYWVLEVSGA